MNISNLDNVKLPRSKRKGGVSESGEVKRGEKTDSARDAKSGQATSSSVDASGVRELDELTQTAMQASVEETDLEQLKEDIQNGSYEPDLEDVADRLISGGEVVDFLTDDQ